MFEGSLISFLKITFKLATYSSFGSVFKIQLFSNLIFENFYPLRADGWATMPCEPY